MIINGFGGMSGGFSGNSTLLKTYSGSYSITRWGSEITLDNSGEIYCSNTSLTKMWHSTNSIAITTWEDFKNTINSRAIKMVFKITSMNITGKIALFCNKSGTTKTQTLNALQIQMCPLIGLRYVQLVDWTYNSASTYGNTTMGNTGYAYGSNNATLSGNVSSVPSSSYTLTLFNYPTFTLVNPPYWSSSYFIQELGTESGEKYWRPFAPSSDILERGPFGYGNISFALQCYASCASGGNSSMKWCFYESSNENVWPIMTLNYALEIYGIN